MGIFKLIGTVFLLCVGSFVFLNYVQFLVDKYYD